MTDSSSSLSIDVPSVCENSHVFNSGISLGVDAHNITLKNNSSQCPVCGTTTPIKDGIYEVVNLTLKVLAASAEPQKTAEAILEVLRSDDIEEEKIIKLKAWFPDSPQKIAAYTVIVNGVIDLFKGIH